MFPSLGRLGNRGSIMLLVLILLVVFVIIMTASVRFIARQSTQTANQEQEEQAFEIADAGINYTLWLLDSEGGNFTPEQLEAGPDGGGPPTADTENHLIHNDQSELIGRFSLDFSDADNVAGVLTVRATGKDEIKPDLCQVIEAKVQKDANGEYRLYRWDHLVGYPCS
ncbi:MAG: PilX N-terminal domain-containing pilus assembly protein [Candidatus Andersenbacteria bacterium]